MKSLIIAGALAGLLVGCGKHAVVEEKAQAASPTSKPGEVTIPPDSPKLNQIKVATVATAQVPAEEVVAPGKVEVNANHVSHVALPLAGRISEVLVRLGDQVKRGQTLLLLESPDADAAMSNYLSSEAVVNNAKSSQLKASSDYDRVKDLFEHKAIAQKEVINAENMVAQAKAVLDQSLAAREQAQRKLELLGLKKNAFGQKVAVTAPISGKILELTVASGEYRNDTNAPLMTIADLSNVWISSDVPETQIRMIQVGEPLEISLAAYPGQTFRVPVTRIGDTVDPQTRTVKVRAELNNGRGLFRPEMFGSIRHVHSTRSMAVVPASAVVLGDGQNIVYREIARGTFQAVPVKLGSREGDLLGIEQGLKPGDRIVVDGVMLLKAY